jgi:hypothetical protein
VDIIHKEITKMKQKIQIPVEYYSIGKQGEERVSVPLLFLVKLLGGAGYDVNTVGEGADTVIVFTKKK